jgi:hypothetical protein
MKTNTWKNARRAALLLVLFLCALALMSLAVAPQSAQDKQENTDTAENISINNPAEKDFSKYYKSDRVTKAVRDKAMMPIRVIVQTDADREEAKQLGAIIADYGAFVVVAVSKNRDLSNSRLETAEIKTTIHLPGKSFEPLQNPPAETVKADGTSINFGGKDYYVVQLGSIANDELLDSLRSMGVEILQYVPHQAFFVYGDGEAIRKIANHSRVRWVGRYMPEDKLSSVINAQLAATKGAVLDSKISPFEMTGNDTAIFDIAIWSRADLNVVKSAVESFSRLNIKHEIRLPNNYFNVLRVEMPLDAVSEIAKLSDVIRIDGWGKPRREDERAAHIVAGNYTSTTTISGPGYNPLTQFGVDGTNVTVSVVDDGVSIPGNGGFYITATNTVNGPLRGAAAGATGGHGHINASIIAGSTPFGILDPTGHNYGLGVASKAHIINIPLLVSGYSGTEADAYNDTVVTPGPNGVNGFISNNSWGFGTNGNVYDSYTAQFDGFVRDASAAGTIDPIVLVFSAGNSGASGLTRPKTAKNVIAVANSENLRTELSASANNIDDLNSSSSRGPAADGRIKPDITAPGTVITGSRAGSCGSVSSCFDANHAWSTGTSHAAPQIAGMAALITQKWKNAFGGTNPSPALVKAAILNTGQEMNGVGTTTAIPNGNEGWGRANMKFILGDIGFTFVNQTTAFTDTGNSSTITGKVENAGQPIRISLVWTDPPATVSPALINNLDLTVTVGANTYRGNVFSGGMSTTGGTADTLNNIEHVWLPAGTPAGTTVTIQINATAINGDGILGNADPTDQHFALVAYNVNSQTKVPPADFDGDKKTDLSIFRPSVGQWWYQKSSDNMVTALTFGTSTDRITPGDYDGDGKTDVAFWRPSTGQWFVLRSSNLTFFAAPFGTTGDTPAPADFDGDGRTDLTVFRPSNSTWFTLRSSDNGVTATPFGTSTDIPQPSDYDGDGKSDICIFRPTGGSGSAEWWILRSTAGLFATPFGTATDKPVPGDYTGDGKSDIAFWRPATSNWFVLRSEDLSFFSAPWGASGDMPAPGDYDGDNKIDLAVFRPTISTWFVLRSSGGNTAQAFGAAGDRPVPNAYVP